MSEERKPLETTWVPFWYTNLYAGSPGMLYSILCVQLQSKSAIWTKSKYKEYLTELGAKEKYPTSPLTMWAAFQQDLYQIIQRQGGWKPGKVRQTCFGGRHSLQHSILWEKVDHFCTRKYLDLGMTLRIEFFAGDLSTAGEAAVWRELLGSGLSCHSMVGHVCHGVKIKATF